MSEKTLVLTESTKNANYGKGQFNSLKSVALVELPDGTVVLNFYSQKKNSPGQILRFGRKDFPRFQHFVRKKGIPPPDRKRAAKRAGNGP